MQRMKPSALSHLVRDSEHTGATIPRIVMPCFARTATMHLKPRTRLTTVFVRQGHYAREAIGQSIAPRPDLANERIGELAGFDIERFGLRRLGPPRAAAAGSPPAPTSQGQP